MPAGRPRDEQAEGHCAGRSRQGQVGAKRWQSDGRGSQALPCSGAGGVGGSTAPTLQGGGCNKGCSWDHSRDRPSASNPQHGCLCGEVRLGAALLPGKHSRGLQASEPAPSLNGQSPGLGAAGARATLYWGREQNDEAWVQSEWHLRTSGNVLALKYLCPPALSGHTTPQCRDVACPCPQATVTAPHSSSSSHATPSGAHQQQWHVQALAASRGPRQSSRDGALPRGTGMGRAGRQGLAEHTPGEGPRGRSSPAKGVGKCRRS